MPDSKQVTIEVPSVDSPSHVVDNQTVKLNEVEAGGDGVESDGEKGEDSADMDAGDVVSSGQSPCPLSHDNPDMNAKHTF